MSNSIRSVLLVCAALTVSIIAPADAGPATAGTMAPIAASLPQVDLPKLIDPDGLPQLADPAPVQTQVQPEADQGDHSPSLEKRADLAGLVDNMRSAVPGSRELECLATGIYFESKSEPLVGQLAVGKVIVNRAASGGRFPGSYCGVLFQHGQFSFVRGHALPSVPRSSRQWLTAVAMAKIVHQGLKESSVGNALFFHARRVSPNWRLKRVAAIGNHIFYR